MVSNIITTKGFIMTNTTKEKITFYIPDVDRNGDWIPVAEQFAADIATEFASKFGGSSINKVLGLYGKTTVNMYQVVALAPVDTDKHYWIGILGQIKDTLNLKAILIDRVPFNGSFE
ncbi:hypothetical protein DRH14_03605 [Candidatus Shapirobacteria bacterium]|nr:MAG: hypothetical protein DRH14_03605 [Candidatus Shapirobacteria bacterium]